jgi:hypothetical protein
MPRAILLLCAVLWAAPAGAEWVQAVPCADGTYPAIVVAEVADDVTTLDVSVPGLWVRATSREGEALSEVEVPGGSTLRSLGQPAVATVSRLLAVPEDANVWVEVIDPDVIWVDAAPPLPAAPHPTRRDDPAAWVIDRPLYASSLTWPAEAVVVEGPAMLRKLAVARVEIRATRYDFAAGKLGVLRSARVKVHHDGTAPILAPDALDDRDFAQVFGHHVLNYTLPDDGIPEVPQAMLVVVEEALLDAIEPLVDWKIQRGMKVTVRTLEEVGTATEDVQAAITEAYEQWDPAVAHVLLVGDNVPFYRGDYDQCASDYMFTTLEGDDLLPDVMISRVVGANADDVAIQVNKVLGYEKTPPLGADAEWMRQATGAATDESGGAGIPDHARFDNIAESLDAAGYSVIDKFYVTDGTGSATNVLDAVNEGRGWLMYLGHGSGYDFSSLNPPFSMSHANQLTNTHAWPILTDCSCLNAGFDGADDSLDELLMKLGTPDAPAGTLGVFGSSTSTSWDPAGDIAEGIAYGFLDYGHTSFGAAALYARMYVFERWGSGMDSEWLFQQWLLLGDTSLMMRTQPPIEVAVTYPEGFSLDETSFSVTVTTPAGDPFPGAAVAIHLPGEFDHVANTDAQGIATFAIAASAEGAMEVVVTGRDLATHIGSSQAGGSLGGFGEGCAASPFLYNPEGVRFAGLISTSYPVGSAGALALLGLVILIRRRLH